MKYSNWFVVLFTTLLIASCSNETDEMMPKHSENNIIKVEALQNSPISRGFTSLENYSEGYLCSSSSSSIVTEIYVNDKKEETVALILNENNEVAFYVNFKIDSFLNDRACTFTAYNELEEPLMKGIFDTENERIEITQVYGNDVLARASVKAWLCGMTVGIAGGIMSAAAGTVSAGAGFVVGLSYTALGIAACDGL